MVSRLLTDSRSLTFASETLFFALRTKNNDGHRYVGNLHQLGVRNFLVESTQGLPADANYIVTPNPLRALQQLAAYHRSRFNIPVIGITGSRGKTCVKEWLHQLLGSSLHTQRSPRSFNSQIGVALSLWEIDEETDIAIIEAGISQPGEMARLEAMIRPTMGIFTALTNEHGENFDSLQHKATEKALLFAHCQTIVLDADNSAMTQAIAPCCANKALWSRRGNPDAELQITGTTVQSRCTVLSFVYRGEQYTATVPAINTHHVENAITCLTAMLSLGIPPRDAASRLACLTPVRTRINVIEGMNGCMIVSDSYPSDYNSLAGALDFMARQNTSKLSNTAIISDSADLLIHPDIAYAQMAELLENRSVTRVIGIGSTIGKYANLFRGDTRFFLTTQQFLASMSPSDFENELILVKGAAEYNFQLITNML